MNEQEGKQYLSLGLADPKAPKTPRGWNCLSPSQNANHLAPTGGGGLGGWSSTDQSFFQLLLHIQGFSLSLKADFKGMPRIPVLI